MSRFFGRHLSSCREEEDVGGFLLFFFVFCFFLTVAISLPDGDETGRRFACASRSCRSALSFSRLPFREVSPGFCLFVCLVGCFFFFTRLLLTFNLVCVFVAVDLWPSVYFLPFAAISE